MKTNLFNIKEFLKGIGIIFFYLLLGNILTNISFSLLKNKSSAYIITYLTLTIIFIIIYFKDLKTDVKSFKDNYKSILITTLKYWFIGLIIMILSSFIISLFHIPEISNQTSNISTFQESPIAECLIAIVFAPIIEELVFRRSLKYSSSNKHIYALITGVIFALLHITSSLTDSSSLIMLIYLIPYGSVSIAFGYSYKKTNNIYGTIILHSIHNLISLIELFIIGGLV